MAAHSRVSGEAKMAELSDALALLVFRVVAQWGDAKTPEASHVLGSSAIARIE